jgi:hypothetical protein
MEQEMNRERPGIQRLLLRRALRKQFANATQDERDLIQIALRDDAIFEPFYEQLMHDAKSIASSTGKFSIAATNDGEPVVDNLLELLRWFLDNGPELMKLIEMIVGLFGGAATATIFWADEQL